TGINSRDSAKLRMLSDMVMGKGLRLTASGNVGSFRNLLDVSRQPLSVCSLRISDSRDSAQHFEKRLRVDSIHFSKPTFNIQNQSEWAFVTTLPDASPFFSFCRPVPAAVRSFHGPRL